MASALAEYHALLADLESGEANVCDGLRAQLADRAFEAEGSLRILLAEGLRTINDLRDSGLLHATIADFGQSMASGGGLAQAFQGLRKRLKELAPAFPDAALDEASLAIQRRELTLEYDGESNALILRGNHPFTGAPAVTRVRLAPQAGDVGRIGLDDFFGATGRTGVHASLPTFAPPDCHHRTDVVGATDDRESIDVYASCVASLALARESMYRHARKVSDFGHSRTALRARDPGTATIIGLVVACVGAVIAGAGAAGADPLGLGSPGRDVGFGLTLIAAGALIFVYGEITMAAAAASA